MQFQQHWQRRSEILLQSQLLKANILVVEAEDPFRRSIAERLRLNDYRVIEAEREDEVKRIVRRKKIDVVLLGLKGLGRRGLALLKAIKEIHPPTEVILMIPEEEHTLALSIEGMKLGSFNDVLIPFDMQALFRQIEAAHQHKRQREDSGGQHGLQPSTGHGRADRRE